MLAENLLRFLTLPYTRVLGFRKGLPFHLVIGLEKTTPFEVCTKCPTKATTVYDHRWVALDDAPLRGGRVRLMIRKRRFRCPACGSVFTEPVDGVRRGGRKTERYRNFLLDACDKYQNLEDVRRDFRCSEYFLYSTYYERLELERRKRLYPWPRVIGIDEHSFSREKSSQVINWATVFVDHVNHRLFEICPGKTVADLKKGVEHIPGRERVEYVTQDLSEGFRTFVKETFPNAEIVADAFHVIRLFHDAIKSQLRIDFPDQKAPEIARSLHRSFADLAKQRRDKLETWLLAYPSLSRLHRYKEEIERLFRVRQLYERTRGQFVKLMDEMAKSPVELARRLRNTLYRWRAEIIAAFRTHYSNGRTEGYNCRAKLVKRCAYGFRNFQNYRLRLLQACAGRRDRI